MIFIDDLSYLYEEGQNYKLTLKVSEWGGAFKMAEE